MARVTVLKPFWDVVARRDRKPGDEFVTSDERAKQIESVLRVVYECDAIEWEPSSVEATKAPVHAASPDYVPVDAVELEVVDGEVVEPTQAPEAIVELEPEPEPEPESNYEFMPVTKLRALCKERGINAPARSKKSVLVELLRG